MATRTIAADEMGLADAIAATEEEIFAEGSGAEPLEKSGDHSLEEQGDDLEGRASDEEPEQIEEEPVKEGEEGKTEDAKSRDEKTGKFTAQEDTRLVPSSRLREETAKRTQAEQALADRDRKFEEFRAEQQRRFDELQARITAPRNQQQSEETAPDPFGDPVGFGKQTIDRATQVAEMRYVEGSLSDAAETHGEKFTAAYNELQQTGRTEMQQFGASPTVRKIWSAPNPGKALMRWHQDQLTVREVGSDPAAYREKILADALKDEGFIAKVVEAAGTSARGGNGGRARTTTRLPPSLNSQSGSSHQERDPEMYNDSERSVFDFATR